MQATDVIGELRDVIHALICFSFDPDSVERHEGIISSLARFRQLIAMPLLEAVLSRDERVRLGELCLAAKRRDSDAALELQQWLDRLLAHTWCRDTQSPDNPSSERGGTNMGTVNVIDQLCATLDNFVKYVEMDDSPAVREGMARNLAELRQWLALPQLEGVLSLGDRKKLIESAEACQYENRYSLSLDGQSFPTSDGVPLSRKCYLGPWTELRRWRDELLKYGGVREREQAVQTTTKRAGGSKPGAVASRDRRIDEDELPENDWDRQCNTIENSLSGQSLTLFQELRNRPHYTKYRTLLGIDDLWKAAEPDDRTVKRALKKLQGHLNQISSPIAVTIDNLHTRTKLVPADTQTGT